MINQQQPKFCAIFFSKINPDVLVSTKYIIAIYKGVWRAIAPRSQRSAKKNKNKMGAFPILHQILHTRRVNRHVMMWSQIHARGVQGHAPADFFIY